MGLFPSPLRRGDAARSIEGGGSGPPTPTPVSSAEGEKLELFYALFRKGGGGAEREDDIQPMRWRKLLWNAAWGALATLARQPMSALLTDGTLHYSLGVVRRTMLE